MNRGQLENIRDSACEKPRCSLKGNNSLAVRVLVFFSMPDALVDPAVSPSGGQLLAAFYQRGHVISELR